jgi:hypothetical protein
MVVMGGAEGGGASGRARALDAAPRRDLKQVRHGPAPCGRRGAPAVAAPSAHLQDGVRGRVPGGGDGDGLDAQRLPEAGLDVVQLGDVIHGRLSGVPQDVLPQAKVAGRVRGSSFGAALWGLRFRSYR